MRKGKAPGLRSALLAALAWLLMLNQAVLINTRALRETATEEKREEGTEGTSEAAEGEDGEEAEKAVPAADGRQEEEADVEEAKDTEEENAGEADREEAELRIRVLLMDSGFHSYYHSSVTIDAGGGEKTFTPEDPCFLDGSVVIGPEEGGIQVSSITRAQGNPVYQGTLELVKEQDGLLLINELPLETYLEAVVPSEMPASYHMEALKAQAVCARTYACSQMEEGRLQGYGADVDDSVGFQVYAGASPQERTSRAVRETEGQVLIHDGELIQAYYFSTSAGATSTDEVWGAGEEAPYLKSVECSFDREEPWSSWEVSIPWALLEERAADHLSCPGALLGLEAAARSQGGAVKELVVSCENGSFQLTGEYQVREFLSPENCAITGRDGERLESGGLLPSAYFSMETVSGEKAVLHGGGYGHGVGMSQNGANEMGREGYGYREILDYFFRDVELVRQEELPGSTFHKNG